MADHSCHSSTPKAATVDSPCCHEEPGRPDYLLWVSLALVAVLYGYQLLAGVTHHASGSWYHILPAAVFELINTMWWGVLVGIVMLALLSKVPRELVMSALGTGGGLRGILRATAAGVMLDLCSHGILMVGAKLYERGASIGQIMAFLIASPWNSFSLTLILFALIGVGWTLAFIGLSMLVAIIVGMLYEALVKRGQLPANPHTVDLPANFQFWPEARQLLRQAQFSPEVVAELLWDGVKESRMVVRWLLFGVLLASLIRAFVPPEMFGEYFGPSLLGLMLTVVAATIIEVCSEGSTPIAADLLTRAQAPGNSFAFLMTGVSTDYTEIMVLRDTTKSWRIPLMLPLLTVPQVMLIAWLLNGLVL